MHPTAIVLQAVGKYPLSESLYLLGKVGVSAWQFDSESSYRVTGIANPINERRTGDDDGVDALFGAGVEKLLAAGSSLRFDIEKLTLNTEEDLDLTVFAFHYVHPF